METLRERVSPREVDVSDLNLREDQGGVGKTSRAGSKSFGVTMPRLEAGRRRPNQADTRPPKL